jgi:hypothetical protein
MTAVPSNPYDRWLSDDNHKCLPVLNKQDMDDILAEVAFRVASVMGKGPPPAMTALDLEQIQVADYAAFDGVSEVQAEAIRKFHTQSPIRPDEMLYLGLRSLFQFTWSEPESEHDIRFAAAYDFVLKQILAERALKMSNDFSDEGALLPYWARMAFLRVMRGMPLENAVRFGLSGTAVALVKKAKFNATTWAFENGPVIALNYALEPILKQLNRFILHYHSTKEMAGPTRLQRAWRGMMPIVLHFWSDVSPARMLETSVPIYGEDAAVMLHRLTSSQVDFIVSHELGHVALDHPRRLQKAREAGNPSLIRHEFEFGADAFALGLMRSQLIDRMKHLTNANGKPESTRNPASDILFELHEHQRGVGAAHLLLIYMDFIQRAGEMLGKRLAHTHRVPISERMDTHPHASQRLDRLELMNAGDRLYTSPLKRFAGEFFEDILKYATALDEGELAASLV